MLVVVEVGGGAAAASNTSSTDWAANDTALVAVPLSAKPLPAAASIAAAAVRRFGADVTWAMVAGRGGAGPPPSRCRN